MGFLSRRGEGEVQASCFRRLWASRGRFRDLFGSRALAPEQPLQRHAVQATVPCLGHDYPGYIRWKLLALRELLDGRLRYRRSDLRGELPIGQRDAVPGAKDVQEQGKPLPYGARLRSVFGLDRGQMWSHFSDVNARPTPGS